MRKAGKHLACGLDGACSLRVLSTHTDPILHLEEALGAGLAPLAHIRPLKPARSHQPPETQMGWGAVFQTVLGPPSSACPCSHLVTVTMVALVPLVFTQERVQPTRSRLLSSPALPSPKTVCGWKGDEEEGKAVPSHS